MNTESFNRMTSGVILLGAIMLCGCDLVVRDVPSLGVFQILWVYYRLLILSRPVIAWNMVAVVINFLSVGAYLRFARREQRQAPA